MKLQLDGYETGREIGEVLGITQQMVSKCLLSAIEKMRQKHAIGL